MANTILQSVGAFGGAGTTIAATFASPCTPGSIIVACVGSEATVQTTITVADGVNVGNYSNDSGLCTGVSSMTNSTVTIQTKANTSSSALTVTATFGTSAAFRNIYLYELSGPPTSSYLDSTMGEVDGTPAGGVATGNIVTTTPNTSIVAIMLANGGTITAGTNFTLDRFLSNGFNLGNERWLDSGAAGTIAVSFNNSVNSEPFVMTAIAIKVPSTSPTPSAGAGTLTGVQGRMDLGITGRSMIRG